MYMSRNEFLSAAVDLGEHKLLPLIVAEIKQDIFKEWLLVTDKEELARLRTVIEGLDRFLGKFQDYRNELDVLVEDWEDS